MPLDIVASRFDAEQAMLMDQRTDAYRALLRCRFHAGHIQPLTLSGDIGEQDLSPGTDAGSIRKIYLVIQKTLQDAGGICRLGAAAFTDQSNIFHHSQHLSTILYSMIPVF